MEEGFEQHDQTDQEDVEDEDEVLVQPRICGLAANYHGIAATYL